jgi:hypothetical protein
LFRRADTCPEDAATLKLYVVESDHRLGGLMVALVVAFAANGTGIVWAVVCFYMLLAEVSNREPSGVSEEN